MNKRQRKKRRKLYPTFNEWLIDLSERIADVYGIDPDSIGVKESQEKT